MINLFSLTILFFLLIYASKAAIIPFKFDFFMKKICSKQFFFRKMSGFSYNSERPTKNPNSSENKISNGASAVGLNHSSSSSALLNRKLSRKLSEQRDFSFVSSPEEFVQKFGGNRVIKKVTNDCFKHDWFMRMKLTNKF